MKKLGTLPSTDRTTGMESMTGSVRGRLLRKSTFESNVHYVCVRRDREHIEPRSGGRNIAQGAAEGGTLGNRPNRESPEGAAGSPRPTPRPVNAHFPGGIMNPRIHGNEIAPNFWQAKS